MSNWLISLFMAAGVSAFVYSKLGRRVGYGNQSSVWTLIGASFIIVFLFVFTLLRYVIHLH